MERKTIGRYEILGELGRGAMGAVLRAQDPVMGRVVAIKYIHASSLAGDQAAEFRERFYREARAAGALSHPGIVPVFDVGEDDGAPYLVMELVQGRTLDAILKQGERYSLDRICQIGSQIGEALGFAHHKGVIHRDIKPANILMTSREVYGTERPRITDFGVAKLAGGEMTTTGQLLGTPAFMPPEQFTGAPIDGRTDLFALGVILYRMATGEQPFPGETLTAVSYKVVHTEPIPPSKLNPAVPSQLEAVILKCLAKNPVARYQTGEELAADLSAVRTGALGTSAHSTIAHTPPVMDSGAGETIDQVASLRPKAGATRTSAAPSNVVVMESAARSTTAAPHPDAFVSQMPAPQAEPPATAPTGAIKRPMLVLMWVGVGVLAALGTRFFLHLHSSEPAQPVPPQSAAVQPVAAPASQPDASPAPAEKIVTPPTPPADAKNAATPAVPKPAVGTVPGASTAAINFNPKSLNPDTNARLKLNLDGFSAPLIVTIQMDGKLYWSGTAGDPKAYQGLLVPPGKHAFRVVVKGQGPAKTSNTANGDFIAKKRLTLNLKLRPQAAGGSATLDPKAEVSASLKKDLFPF